MLQYIDVRDLADWLVDVGERGVTGIFNATGPRLSFLELVQAVAAVTGAQASLVSLTEEQMRDAEVEAWTDIPLCFPPDDKSVAHFFDVDSRRARSAGLLLRPTADTVADTWSWCRDRIADLRCGLTPEREAQLLESVRP